MLLRKSVCERFDHPSGTFHGASWRWRKRFGSGKTNPAGSAYCLFGLHWRCKSGGDERSASPDKMDRSRRHFRFTDCHHGKPLRSWNDRGRTQKTRGRQDQSEENAFG